MNVYFSQGGYYQATNALNRVAKQGFTGETRDHMEQIVDFLGQHGSDIEKPLASLAQRVRKGLNPFLAMKVNQVTLDTVAQQPCGPVGVALMATLTQLKRVAPFLPAQAMETGIDFCQERGRLCVLGINPIADTVTPENFVKRHDVTLSRHFSEGTHLLPTSPCPDSRCESTSLVVMEIATGAF